MFSCNASLFKSLFETQSAKVSWMFRNFAEFQPHVSCKKKMCNYFRFCMLLEIFVFHSFVEHLGLNMCSHSR